MSHILFDLDNLNKVEACIVADTLPKVDTVCPHTDEWSTEVDPECEMCKQRKKNWQYDAVLRAIMRKVIRKYYQRGIVDPTWCTFLTRTEVEDEEHLINLLANKEKAE